MTHTTPPNDRREEERYVSVLRICCIETSQGASFALLRNISANGAQIEADIPDPVGSPISYFFDDNFRVEAEIAWKKDGRAGLVNRTFSGSNAQSFPRRALRVPLSEPAKAWINGIELAVSVANISQSGALLLGKIDAPVGALITLQIGRLELHNVSLRWFANNSAGAKFERPLHMRELKQIVESRHLRIGGGGGNYREGRPYPSGATAGPQN